MLSQLEITGFQSVHSASIELGRLTVVTGESNSGKSSLIRALEGLAENLRGTDYISTGKSACTIAVVAADEGWGVRLTRTRSHKGDEYRTAPGNAVFTKLAGAVPPEVSARLRISSLNVDRQLDPPFLLTRTGREAAEVLGDLTNVSMVLLAAVNAGRIRKGLSRDLKTAEARVAELKDQTREFEGLPERLAAVSAAEEMLARLGETQTRRARLGALLDQLRASQEVADVAAEAVAAAEPPSLDRLQVITERLGRLRQLVTDVRDLTDAERAWSATLHVESDREAALHDGLHQALLDAGTCPTCGQAIAA